MKILNMKIMSIKINRRSKMISLIAVIGMVTAVVGNACQGFEQNLTPLGASSTGGNELLCESQADFLTIEGAKTASLVKADDTLDNLLSCIAYVYPDDPMDPADGFNESKISQATKDVFTQRYASLSKEGYAGDVNSAMMMGVAAISIEFCNDVINYEASLNPLNRVFFKSVDFNATTMGAAQVDNALRLFAMSCWGRDATQDEINIVNEELELMGAINNRMRSISICGSALASLDGVKSAD